MFIFNRLLNYFDASMSDDWQPVYFWLFIAIHLRWSKRDVLLWILQWHVVLSIWRTSGTFRSRTPSLVISAHIWIPIVFNILVPSAPTPLKNPGGTRIVTRVGLFHFSRLGPFTFGIKQPGVLICYRSFGTVALKLYRKYKPWYRSVPCNPDQQEGMCLYIMYV